MMVLSTVGWTLLYQLAVNKMPARQSGISYTSAEIPSFQGCKADISV